MASAPSFDIVSKVDRQEVDNAFNQAEKELATRFDFRGTGTVVAKSGEAFTITSEQESESEWAPALELSMCWTMYSTRMLPSSQR